MSHHPGQEVRRLALYRRVLTSRTAARGCYLNLGYAVTKPRWAGDGCRDQEKNQTKKRAARPPRATVALLLLRSGWNAPKPRPDIQYQTRRAPSLCAITSRNLDKSSSASYGSAHKPALRDAPIERGMWMADVTSSTCFTGVGLTCFSC